MKFHSARVTFDKVGYSILTANRFSADVADAIIIDEASAAGAAIIAIRATAVQIRLAVVEQLVAAREF